MHPTPRRNNAMPSRYLSQVVKSISNAEQEDIFSDTLMDNQFAHARSAIAEYNMYREPFYKQLRDYETFITQGYVTWGDLNGLLPDFDSKTRYAPMSNEPRSIELEHRAMGSQQWSGATHETVVASIISQSMGTILSSCLLTYVDCQFSKRLSMAVSYSKLTRTMVKSACWHLPILSTHGLSTVV